MLKDYFKASFKLTSFEKDPQNDKHVNVKKVMDELKSYIRIPHF